MVYSNIKQNMKLNFTDEKTFKSELIEFENDHFNIAKKLHDIYKDDDISICSPIMVGQDKKSLLFCLDTSSGKDRVEMECGFNKYRVRVEKIEIEKIIKNRIMEIIYDNKQEKVLSYKELDPRTLTQKWCDFYKQFVWIQYENDDVKRRVLFNSQILTNF